MSRRIERRALRKDLQTGLTLEISSGSSRKMLARAEARQTLLLRPASPMTPGAFKINKNCGHCHGVDVMTTSLPVPVEIQMRERGQEDCPRRTDDLRHLILCLLYLALVFTSNT